MEVDEGSPSMQHLFPLELAAHWRLGWALVLAGFLSGAVLGLGFHRPRFLGGYDSLQRRLLRLGHVALVALGMLNLLYVAAPGGGGDTAGTIASLGLAAGAIAMPAVCFLSAWRPRARFLFALPVSLLVAAATAVLSSYAPFQS